MSVADMREAGGGRREANAKGQGGPDPENLGVSKAMFLSPLLPHPVISQRYKTICTTQESSMAKILERNKNSPTIAWSNKIKI
jgi:hypothetical protein